MTPLILMLLLVSVQTETIELDLPGNPEHGLRMTAEGKFYMVRAGGGVVRAVRYVRDGRSLREEFVVPHTFSGMVEFLPYGGGMAIADYESGRIHMFDREWKELWEADAGYPGVARLAPGGNIWFTKGGSWITWKTPDSSEVEPVLTRRGVEVRVPGVQDIAPDANGGFYSVDANGRVAHTDRTGTDRLLARGIEAQRIFTSRLGGVALFERAPDKQVIHHVSDDGRVTEIWRAPSTMPGMNHASRTGDGRILLGAMTPSGGKGYIIDPEAGR